MRSEAVLEVFEKGPKLVSTVEWGATIIIKSTLKIIVDSGLRET